MAPVIILKLGGSMVTDKRSGRPVVQTALIRTIAYILVRYRRVQPTARLFLLHGGGSFGHPLAHRFRLTAGRLTARQVTGLGLTTNAMRELTTRIARLCLAAGLPVFPLQTSALVAQRGRRVQFTGLHLIRTIVQSGGIPLLGGDALLVGRRQAAIASADALAVLLARHWPRAAILLATDVDGVYGTWPPLPGAKPLPSLSRRALEELIKHSPTQTERDVTGAMIGKLRALLALRQRSVRIFNGTHASTVRAALRGEAVGTLIRV